MGIYSAQNESLDQELRDPNELLEMFMFDELCHLSDEKKEEFINSEAAQALIEARVISKKTLVRLSKTDDLSRRMKMAAFQLAKENDDMIWNQLVKVRIKERELINKIVTKYGSKAEKAARVGQREYIKNRSRLPKIFTRDADKDDRR